MRRSRAGARPGAGQLLLLPGCLSERDWQVLRLAGVYCLDGVHPWAGGSRRRCAPFGWTPTRYFQVLNAMLDRVAVADANPELVHRLRELRPARRQARTAEAARAAVLHRRSLG